MKVFFMRIHVIMCVLLVCMQSASVLEAGKIKLNKRLLPVAGAEGNLYDIFRKRLISFCEDLSVDGNAVVGGSDGHECSAQTNMDSEVELAEREVTPDAAEERSATANFANIQKALADIAKMQQTFLERKLTAEGYGKNFDLNYDEAAKRSTINECISEVFKRRLKDIRYAIPQIAADAQAQARVSAPKRDSLAIIRVMDFGNSPRLRQNMFKNYRKQLDDINSVLFMHNPAAKQADYNRIIKLNPSSLSADAVDYDDETMLYDDDLGTSSLHRRNAADKDQFEQEEEAVYDNAYLVEISTSYPALLSKADNVSISAGVMAPVNVPPNRNLLESVALKMNLTSLQLAQKVASMTENSIKNDPKLSQAIKRYMTNTVEKSIENTNRAPKEAHIAEAKEAVIKSSQVQDLQHIVPCVAAVEDLPAPTGTTTANNANITAVLDKLLAKLEHMPLNEDEETSVNNGPTECAPCDVLGSWSSLAMGLRFEIAAAKPTERTLATAEENNKLLTITVSDSVPAKQTDIVDKNWKFMGSALKSLGGPFYMYSQKRSENVLTTFLGFCRTCGGIDSIFGAWTFIFPSKDCEDISVSTQTKHDLMRRNKMDAMRKERYKNILYNKSKMGQKESAGCGI